MPTSSHKTPHSGKSTRPIPPAHRPSLCPSSSLRALWVPKKEPASANQEEQSTQLKLSEVPVFLQTTYPASLFHRHTKPDRPAVGRHCADAPNTCSCLE